MIAINPIKDYGGCDEWRTVPFCHPVKFPSQRWMSDLGNAILSGDDDSACQVTTDSAGKIAAALLKTHRCGISNMILSTKNLGLLGLSLFVLVAQTAVTEGKDNVFDRYKKREFRNPAGQTLHYRWYVPSDLKENETVPILLFLHGAGERGDDNQKTLVHGAKDFLSDKLQSLQKCAILIPQCPHDQQWVNVPWTDDEHTLPTEPSTPLTLVSQLLDELCDTHPIDENRIYLSGLSMGGFGAWDLVSRAPNRFAAVIPICGGGDSRAAVVEKFKHVPVWAFHGDADPTVKVKRSRDMIHALRTAGGEPEYTEYPSVGHDSWTSTYANPKIYQWLLTHRRNDDN